MVVTRIKASNFKSFKDIDISLNKFNVLIGANASGKTNFIQIFKFLRNLKNHGLENAVSMQGGVEYLRNINIGSSEDLEISISVDDGFSGIIPIKDRLISIQGYEYFLSINFSDNGVACSIKKEILKLNCQVRLCKGTEDRMISGEILGEGNIEIYREYGKVIVNSDIKDLREIDVDDLMPFHIFDISSTPDTILKLITNMYGSSNNLNGISFYDIDPKIPKQTSLISGKIDLEEDGRNIALVMKHLFEDKEKKRKFSNLINDILPFIEDVRVEKYTDYNLLLTLKEIYFKKELPLRYLVWKEGKTSGSLNFNLAPIR